MKGYKVFNPDWTCNSFQYEVGKEFTHEGRVVPCESGFHYCPKPVDCFNYYNFNPENHVAEVEAHGMIVEHGDKCVTNRILIVREIPWAEVLDLVNTGKGNTGHSNSGDWNSGDWNSGSRNSGDWNSGHSNSGSRNSGSRNSGDWNSGDWNSGHSNSGDWNSCNYSSGSFCSIEPEFLLFNKPSPISREDFRWSDAARICRRLRVVDDESNKIDYRQAWSNLWESLPNQEKIIVQSMPNFDSDVFKEITGIEV